MNLGIEVIYVRRMFVVEVGGGGCDGTWCCILGRLVRLSAFTARRIAMSRL